MAFIRHYFVDEDLKVFAELLFQSLNDQVGLAMNVIWIVTVNLMHNFLDFFYL